MLGFAEVMVYSPECYPKASLLSACLDAQPHIFLFLVYQVLLRALLVSILVERDRISFFLLGKQSTMVPGNQVGDAEIQEPSAPHSKTHPSQSTKAL